MLCFDAWPLPGDERSDYARILCSPDKWHSHYWPLCEAWSRGCLPGMPSIVQAMPPQTAPLLPTARNRTSPQSLLSKPRRWYDANAGIVWPWGQAPTLEQTKKHAKGMRRLEDIPAYFREYRLKCKGQDHTEVGERV